MKKKFIAVNLTSKKEHETKLSFLDDLGNEAFNYWWNEIGAIQFMEYIDSNEEYSNYFDTLDRDFKIIQE